MENLLLCSKTLYDKDLLDKTKEIEKLRGENNYNWKLLRQLRHDFLEHYNCSDRDKIHFCNQCSSWLCSHFISDATENMAVCGLCNAACVYLNAEEQEIDYSFEKAYTKWYKESGKCGECEEIKEKLAPIYDVIGFGVEGWCLDCILKHIMFNSTSTDLYVKRVAFDKWKHA